MYILFELLMSAWAKTSCSYIYTLPLIFCILVCLKMDKASVIVPLVSSSPQLDHWNWSVVARLVCFNLTSQPWLRYSDVFNSISIWAFLLVFFWWNTLKTRFSNNFFFISYHIFVFVALFRTKKITELNFWNLQFLL